MGFKMKGKKMKNLFVWTPVVLVCSIATTAFAQPTANYIFKETAPGTWNVLIEVAGAETSGLSAYEFWVDGVDPATVSFSQNVLSTVVGIGFDPVGFMSLLQGDVGGSFNAGNYQESGSAAIQGIGMLEVYEEGSDPGITPLVDLDVPALLGTLSTPQNLGAENFRVSVVGLLNAAGDDFYDTSGITPTMEVIPEPVTLSLLVFGGVGLLKRKRK